MYILWLVCCVAADVCETAGSRELAVQALLSMDSPNTESRTFLNTVVPNGNTSTTHTSSLSTQSKTGELKIYVVLYELLAEPTIQSNRILWQAENNKQDPVLKLGHFRGFFWCECRASNWSLFPRGVQCFYFWEVTPC